MDDMVDRLKTENIKLTGKLKRIQHELIETKQYSKLDNLVITGVLATFSEVAVASGAATTRLESNDATVTKVIDFAKHFSILKFVKEIFRLLIVCTQENVTNIHPLLCSL